MTALEKATKAGKFLFDKKAEQLEMIEIRDISSIADYFVIATGTSNTHVSALADEVDFKFGELGIHANHIEGHHSNTWVVLDYGDVIIHIFTRETRTFYDLDRLWQDGKKVQIDWEE